MCVGVDKEHKPDRDQAASAKPTIGIPPSVRARGEYGALEPPVKRANASACLLSAQPGHCGPWPASTWPPLVLALRNPSIWLRRLCQGHRSEPFERIRTFMTLDGRRLAIGCRYEPAAAAEAAEESRPKGVRARPFHRLSYSIPPSVGSSRARPTRLWPCSGCRATGHAGAVRWCCAPNPSGMHAAGGGERPLAPGVAPAESPAASWLVIELRWAGSRALGGIASRAPVTGSVGRFNHGMRRGLVAESVHPCQP